MPFKKLLKLLGKIDAKKNINEKAAQRKKGKSQQEKFGTQKCNAFFETIATRQNYVIH